MGNCCKKKVKLNKTLDKASAEPSFERYDGGKNNESDLNDKKSQITYSVIFLRAGKQRLLRTRYVLDG